MGFGMIAAGFVFLFNPMYNIIDVLPDFIGAMLIYCGMTKTAVLNDDLKASRTKVMYYGLIETVKLISLIFLSSADGMRYLVLGTVFGILECICFIPAVNELFDGIEHIGMTYNSSSINKTYSKKVEGKLVIREYSSFAKKITIAFFILRDIFSVLPELTELRTNEYSGIVDSRMIDYTTFKPLLYLFSTILVLIFSVYYLRTTLKFWLSVKNDKPFIDTIKNKYNSFTQTNKYYFSARKINGIIMALSVAAVMIFTLAPDKMWFFPTALCALIIGSLSIITVGNVRKTWIIVSASILSASMSIVAIFLNSSFHDKFRLDEIFMTLFPDATEAYFRMSMVYTLEKVFLSIAFVSFIILLRKAILDLVPKSVRVRSASNMDNNDLCDELTVGIKKRIRLCTVFSAITIIYSAILPYVYFLTGTLYEANLNDFKEGKLDIVLYICSSYSLYFAVFSMLVITTFVLICSLKGYIKAEICDPICNWGIER